MDKLLSLSLDGHPAHDTTGKTVLVWAEAICDRRVFDEAADRPRFRAAFRTLMQRETRWPSPAKFLDALPSNVVPFQKLPRLESEKRRVAGLEAIANINKIIGYHPPRDDDNGPSAA
ncbi:MAG: hypothetical protein AAGC76_09565 [Luteibacter sp.]|uniref:hypothetical protein n=1 Tax=Luteibacter sp. TaxID=1886636 RepID=UPI0028071B81|nr:hypothetical protein [Luteibacter sp.]MDQ7996088.1 hypothetical protein [Luteibacter sp.]